jgi:hypothetical protein
VIGSTRVVDARLRYSSSFHPPMRHGAVSQREAATKLAVANLRVHEQSRPHLRWLAQLSARRRIEKANEGNIGRTNSKKS